MVASSKNVIETSSVTIILDNNGFLEGSKMVAPSKNVIGKKKGTKDQGDSSEKFAETLRPTMLQQHARFSFLGNAQKLASKERACSSTNVECQHVQLGGVASFRNSKLYHEEGISITPTLVNKSETAHSSYSNVLKGTHFGPNMHIPAIRPMDLKFYQPSHCGNRKCVSPPLEIAENGSKAWKKCLWNEEGLSHIASAVGKPLYADSLTESMKRISYARVCIEINATCELVDSFDLFMGDNSGPNLGESVEILVE
ncbi:hypothetical protein Dsin_017342 [Dipteronia sinensis]|uniref:Uncharacterized protein n=1 Tax=Dipteronia sinensis TaxID=43782 RepID=A0AAE0AER6_9ROSI|nr:hypothetical protein Dsin_017342 [Dipteronia sinensis]